MPLATSISHTLRAYWQAINVTSGLMVMHDMGPLRRLSFVKSSIKTLKRRSIVWRPAPARGIKTDQHPWLAARLYHRYPRPGIQAKYRRYARGGFYRYYPLDNKPGGTGACLRPGCIEDRAPGSRTRGYSS